MMAIIDTDGKPIPDDGLFKKFKTRNCKKMCGDNHCDNNGCNKRNRYKVKQQGGQTDGK